MNLFTVSHFIHVYETGSRYITNANFETTLPQHVDGVGRKYILVLGSLALSPRYFTRYENKFSPNYHSIC